MKAYLLGLCLFIMFSLNACDNLKYVAVVVRHGARAPQVSIPGLNKISNWPNGFEELTASGQRMMYLFGKHLREKYIQKEHLLPETYDPSKIAFRSTYYHRTTVSAESLAAGLYEIGLERLTNSQFSNENIWVPPQTLHINEYIKKELNHSALPFDLPSIPILNYAVDKDREIFFSSCKAYGYYRRAFYNSTEYKHLMEKYLPKFEKVCALLNVDCHDLDGHWNFLYADYILAAEFDNQWPFYSNHTDLVDHMERFYTDLMLGEIKVNELQNKIAMHGFSELIVPLLENARKNPDKALKMNIFETHDITILQYLLALGFKKENLYDTIAYATNMIFELRENNGAMYINLLYNDKILMDKMPLDSFIEGIKAKGKLDKDIEEICKIPEPKDNSMKANNEIPMMIWILLGAVCISILAKVIYGMTRKQKRNNNERYNTIENVVIINN